jgi:hypothetical protein
MRSPRLTTNGSVGSVFNRTPVVEGVATARQHEPGVPRRDGHRQAGGDQAAAAGGGDHGVLASPEVEPRVAGMGVRRQRQVGIEADDRHREHGARAYDPAPVPRSCRDHTRRNLDQRRDTNDR